MSADASKKLKLEQQAAGGLLVVFLITFAMGPAKHWIAPHSAAAKPAAPLLGRVELSRPLGETLQQRLEQLTTPSEARFSAPRDQVATPPAYAAQELRDPLKSLLPQEPPHQEGATSRGQPQGPTGAAEEPVAPPHLVVQGLWWGAPKPKAIVNGQLYGIGDQVDGARITAIGREGVTVEYGGTSAQVAAPNSSRAVSESAAQPSEWR